MSRLFSFTVFSCLLFCVGLAAGRLLQQQTFRTQGKPDSAAHRFATDPRLSAAADEPFPLMPKPDVESGQADAVLPARHQPSDSGRPAAQSVVSAEHSRRMIATIQEVFPETPMDTAEVWAEVYEDTDLDVFRFILEQRKQVSPTLTFDSFDIQADIVADIPGTLPSPSLTDSHEMPPLYSERSSVHCPADADCPTDADCPVATASSGTVDSVAIHSVRSNLACVWTIGYRRNVVLPEPLVSPVHSVLPTDGGHSFRSPEFVSFRTFDTGKLQWSPGSSHVAITRDGPFVFSLEGDRFTRRGDFQILPDRRIGLITSAGIFPLKGSPVVSPEHERLSISPDGTISLNTIDGQTVETGTIPVVEILDADQLRTDDGVIFAGANECRSVPVSPIECGLRSHCLELSNVSAAEESALLSQLNSSVRGQSLPEQTLTSPE